MRVTEDYTVLYIVPLQSNSHLELLLHVEVDSLWQSHDLVGLEYNEGIIHIISNTSIWSGKYLISSVWVELF